MVTPSLRRFCSPASARTPLLCRDTPSMLAKGSYLKHGVTGSGSQRRAPWRSSVWLAIGWMVGLEPKMVSVHIKGSIVLLLLASMHTKAFKPDALFEKTLSTKKGYIVRV